MPTPPKTIVLKTPVQLGTETVTELTLTANSKAFRGFTLTRTEAGVVYDPYSLANLACRMAGRGNEIADKLDVEDMNILAEAAMDFLGAGLRTGSEP